MDRVMVTDLIQQDGHIAGAIGFSPDDDDTFSRQKPLFWQLETAVSRTAASEPIQLLAMHRRWPIGWAVPLPVRSGRISMALTAISRPTLTGNDRNPYYNKNDETCKTLADHLPMYNIEGKKIDSTGPT